MQIALHSPFVAARLVAALRLRAAILGTTHSLVWVWVAAWLADFSATLRAGDGADYFLLTIVRRMTA